MIAIDAFTHIGQENGVGIEVETMVYWVEVAIRQDKVGIWTESIEEDWNRHDIQSKRQKYKVIGMHFLVEKFVS